MWAGLVCHLGNSGRGKMQANCLGSPYSFYLNARLRKGNPGSSTFRKIRAPMLITAPYAIGACKGLFSYFFPSSSPFFPPFSSFFSVYFLERREGALRALLISRGLIGLYAALLIWPLIGICSFRSLVITKLYVSQAMVLLSGRHACH